MENLKETVITSRAAGEIIVFDIDGRLARSAKPLPVLSELVKTQLSTGKNRILLNLERTGFVDSVGVGELISSFTSTQNIGGALKICRIPDQLDLLFKITGLIKVLPVFPTDKDALEAFPR